MLRCRDGSRILDWWISRWDGQGEVYVFEFRRNYNGERRISPAWRKSNKVYCKAHQIVYDWKSHRTEIHWRTTWEQYRPYWERLKFTEKGGKQVFLAIEETDEKILIITGGES